MNINSGKLKQNTNTFPNEIWKEQRFYNIKYLQKEGYFKKQDLQLIWKS